ncbi:O-methyltransferase [Plantactinospora sonchi]|uniref:Class I SAM-dependent methyltransferase n=1 Tax=Plantactinospora sonchi TaxID=1544735 RepID=A0ABU7RYF1_9ACTN
MTTSGTTAYDECPDLPPLVAAAVAVARRAGFAQSCLPAQGRLLHTLAGGIGAGTIGETGTGCGVGLAWLASGAAPDARLVSVERDPERAGIAAEVFAAEPRVRVRHGDWRDLRDDGPFDLLVLDGGGQGKGVEPPLDPGDWLRPGGVVVLDDFTPTTDWPPLHCGRPDTARLYWLTHPRLHATEVRVTPTAATILARYLDR